MKRNHMEELIHITVNRNRKTKMIKLVSEEINRALSIFIPPMNDEKDILRLRRYIRESDRIKLIYEILRGARFSKKEQNRSPYREIGIAMQVGRNS
ncbi:MAG: hypothetical protein ABII26_02180 [Pseudomonadota bacterium]